MEYFDILDENRKPTGKVKTREEAHAKGLWHSGIHVWVVNDKNQLLIQKRTANKKTHPNEWTVTIGGHISSGEDSITTCIKEAKEEIGMEIAESDLEFICTTKTQTVHNNNTYFNNEFRDIYLVRRNLNVDKLSLQKDEVAEIKFIDVEKFKEKIDNKDPKFVTHYEEYNQLFEYLDK